MRRVVIAVFVSVLALVGPALAAKPPGPGPASSSVTIAASPNPVVFGSSSSITGQATGKKSGGATVSLQAQTSPSKFTTITSTTADATGHYTFKVTPTQNTVYRVVAKTAPQATSPNLLLKVKVKVTLRVGTTTPKAGSLVRFYGFVLPAYNGRLVQIQRKTHTGWKTVAHAKLAAATPAGGVARSKYSKRLRIFTSGTYRAYFNPADTLRYPNASPTRTLHVHS